MTDEQLMREALEALKLLVEEFATSTTGRCMNCGLMRCRKGCEFGQARIAIAKLEERLLQE